MDKLPKCVTDGLVSLHAAVSEDKEGARAVLLKTLTDILYDDEDGSKVKVLNIDPGAAMWIAEAGLIALAVVDLMDGRGGGNLDASGFLDELYDPEADGDSMEVDSRAE